MRRDSSESERELTFVVSYVSRAFTRKEAASKMVDVMRRTREISESRREVEREERKERRRRRKSTSTTTLSTVPRASNST